MVAQPRPVESEGVTRRFPLPGWQPISTDTGWTLTNCSPYGSGWADPEFKFDPETGQVEVRGFFQISGASPSVTIPVHLRPTAGHEMTDCRIYNGAESTTRLEILTTGEFRP